MTSTTRTSPFRGIPNFRDLGGHTTTDGRKVRLGRIYRSQGFGEATLADRDLLNSYNFRTIFDLRSERERKRTAAAWPHGTDVRRLDFNARNDLRAHMGEFVATIVANPNSHGVEQAMLTTYRSMASTFAPILPIIFDHLLADTHMPAIVHCHAGKDRTGFVCAAILTALGVPASQIMADYENTNDYLEITQMGEDLSRNFNKNFGLGLTIEALRPALEARREYLELALAHVAKEYGGMERYLEDAAGLSPDRRELLKNQLLEAPEA